MVERNYPTMEELQRFLDWSKNLSEKALKAWLLDAFFKGQLSNDAEIIKAFVRHRGGAPVQMAERSMSPTKPAIDGNIVYTNHGE